jgi:HNH endonuclease
MMFPKPSRIRVSGKKMSDLNTLIWELDNRCCAMCYDPVPFGTKFHHIKFKSQGGGDTVDNGATLCQTGNNCHGAAHGPKAKQIRAFLLEYVENGRKHSEKRLYYCR